MGQETQSPWSRFTTKTPDDVEVCTHDGHPALVVGGRKFVLRMAVKTEYERGDLSPDFEQVENMETEVNHDSRFGSWWDVTRDDSDEEQYNPYPWVTIMPEVAEDE